MDAGRQVEGGRGGERMGEMEAEVWTCGRDNPQGPKSTLTTLRAAKGWEMDGRRGRRNGPAERDLRG